MKLTAKRLITHADGFHADDVLAYSILHVLYPGAELVRTRSADILQATTDEDIVFDVGFRFDAALRRYDHHQPSRPLRTDGVPYSSVGLVWRYHGLDYLHSRFPEEASPLLESVWAQIDGRFIREIDKADNGYVEPGEKRTPSASQDTQLSRLIEDFAPNWDQLDLDYTASFREAATVFSDIFLRHVAKEVSKRRAHEAVLEAFENAPDPRVVEIPAYMPSGTVVYDHGFDEALYLIETSRNGHFYLSCVRPQPDSFSQRKPLPAEWAGLTGEELSAVTGVPDAVFCHVQRFVCAAASRESILRMAGLALDWEPSEENAPSRRP